MSIECLMGIYAISGVCDQRAYVGSSNDLRRRLEREHIRALESNSHYNQPLQTAWNAFGGQNFVFVILEPVTDVTKLQEREAEHLRNQIEKGAAYNVSSSTSPGARGKKFSKETRERMSKAKRGENHPLHHSKRPEFGATIAKLITKRFKFLSPDGEIVETIGLRPLCEKHGLNKGNMSSVWTGRLRQYKGWTRAPDVDSA
jgi:group I intron endonuclease